MTWGYAKQLANKITNQEIKEVLLNAKNGIIDWSKPSKLNKTYSWGVAWNILAKNFDVNKEYPEFYKINILRMFADWLPENYKQQRKKRTTYINVVHHEPDFTKWV